MGRPAKSVTVKSGAISKTEAAARQAVESKIRGKPAEMVPPEYLTNDQKDIFSFVAHELVESDILSNLDVFVMVSFATAVSRLRQIEAMVNSDKALLGDTALMGARAKYQSDLWRGCSELCLSPQARAKIGNLAAQAARVAEDPLLKALSDDD